MSGNIKSSALPSGPGTQANYQPQDRIEVQPGMPFNPYASLGQVSYPRVSPASGGPHHREGRWREHGILLGLWLLVLLVAAAIGIRVMDLSAGAVRPDDYGRASAAPAKPASLPVLSAARLATDDDPFDEPLPLQPPVAAASFAATPKPAATTAAALRASTDMAAASGQQPAAVASALALAPDDAAVRRPPSEEKMPAPAPARRPAACSPALSAMQLCAESDK